MVSKIYKDLRIVYSPDDGGWYAQQEYGEWKCSKKTYKTESALMRSIDKGTIKF